MSEDSDEKSPVTSAGAELPDNELAEDPNQGTGDEATDAGEQYDDEYDGQQQTNNGENNLKTPNEQYNSNPDEHHLEYDVSTHHQEQEPSVQSQEDNDSSEENLEKITKAKKLGEMLKNFLTRN